MECKFCHAQMEEGTALCPACGRDNAEAPETAEDTAAETAPETASDAEAAPRD